MVKPRVHKDRPLVRDGRLVFGEGPFVLLADAALGYPHLAADVVLRPAAPLLEQGNNLVWAQVALRKGAERSLLSRGLELTDPSVKVTVGLSPKTGWPMHYSRTSKESDWTLCVTKLDARPDLKGVFVVPDDVRTALEKKEKEADDD